MKIIETKVYSFDELSEKAQQRVLNKYYDINVDHDWWDTTCEDAARIGFKITGFDINRGSYVKGKFIQNAHDVAELILKEHGESCDTYRTATKFLAAYDNIMQKEEDALDDETDSFLNSLCDDYLEILRGEYDYLTSKEAIIESIEDNDYTFTVEGKMFNE